ncbi:MAG TPA: tRNA-dihydrouridine synthase family protein [Spirochaetota bacterium]
MTENSRFILAPMAEITTPSLRTAIRSYSPNVTLCSEMLSAYHVLHGGKINRYLLARAEGENLVYQLLGNDPAIMRDAALSLAALSPAGINFNLGCSAPDILKMRCGAHLLKEKELVRDIVRSVRRAISIPFSVKMRAGFESVDLPFTLDFCRMLADEGVDSVTIHGRAAKQGFRGGADWKLVSAVKESLKIPVYGNGDIVTAEDAVSRMNTCALDGVMIGRIAVQKPWIFALCDAIDSKNNLSLSIDLVELCSVILESLMRDLPEDLHKSRAHRFLFYFTKNFRFGHPLMNSIRNESSIPIMQTLVTEYCQRNEAERVVRVEINNS